MLKPNAPFAKIRSKGQDESESSDAIAGPNLHNCRGQLPTVETSGDSLVVSLLLTRKDIVNNVTARNHEIGLTVWLFRKVEQLDAIRIHSSLRSRAFSRHCINFRAVPRRL